MKKLVIISLLLLSAGCVNIMYHVPPEQVTKVYHPTSFVACNGVGVWWNDSYKRKYPIEAAWMELTWFVWIVDLPCEAVFDTITLPYDAYRRHVYNKAQESKKDKHSRFGITSDKQYELNKGNYKINID